MHGIVSTPLFDHYINSSIEGQTPYFLEKSLKCVDLKDPIQGIRTLGKTFKKKTINL